MVDVTVTAIHPDRIEVKLADGRLGAIPASDFRDRTQPSVGQHLDAAMLAREDPKRVWLSAAWAAKVHAWDRLAEARAAHEAVSGVVRRVVKGGAVLDVSGLRAFMPASLADEQPVDLGELVGVEVQVSVIDLDEDADRVVVSRRDVLRRQRREEQRAVLGALDVGRRVSGIVVGIRDFGAQVDLGGGVRGLVHRSELVWGRVGAVGDVVSIGQHVEAIVTEVHKGKRRVSLSIRQLMADPLADVEVGMVAEAEVTRVVEYGAFARLLGGTAEGLIHVSELSEMQGLRPDRVVAPGDQVWVKVIDLDRDRRRMGLSIRQALLS
ncbi:MAG: 30S ribosomal protein S1 [Microthrixaceae bacterium]|nr:30S ribosomal protein S1 [Microthrixaceae bacterium]